MVEETDGHILLVPHTFGSIAENDQDACRKVWQSTSRQYEGRVHMLLREYDQNEIKAVIGRCDFFIGSRMHSCIAALSQAIPTIGLAYSRKFLGVFDSVGMRDMVLDARRLSREELLQGCMARFKKKDAVAKSLRHVMPQIRSQLEACFISEMPVNP